MSTVSGVVEAKSNKFDKYSILVDGNWYSSKYEIKCEKGDTVEFDDGERKYCRKLRVVGAGGAPSPATGGGATASQGSGFPVGTRAKDRSIIRQNATTNARELLVGYWQTEGFPEHREDMVDEIIGVARMFEAYCTGDTDFAEVQKKIDNAFDPED